MRNNTIQWRCLDLCLPTTHIVPYNNEDKRTVYTDSAPAWNNIMSRKFPIHSLKRMCNLADAVTNAA